MGGRVDVLFFIAGIHADGHRSVVEQLHLHVRSENACFYGSAQCEGEPAAERFVERNGDVVAGSADVGGTVAFLIGGEERELADYQCAASGVNEAAVHDSLGVVEDAQLGGLPDEPIHILFCIRGFYTEQDEQTLAYGGMDGAPDGDRGAADALDNGSHGVECGESVFCRPGPAVMQKYAFIFFRPWLDAVFRTASGRVPFRAVLADRPHRPLSAASRCRRFSAAVRAS